MDGQVMGAGIDQRGMELPLDLRTRLERFFAADLSDVRVQESAWAEFLGVPAFAVGSRICFAQGRYAPDAPEGLALLAHELVHVLQQRHGRVPNPLGRGLVLVQDPELEAEAEAAAAAILRGDSWAGLEPCSGSVPSRPGPGSTSGAVLQACGLEQRLAAIRSQRPFQHFQVFTLKNHKFGKVINSRDARPTLAVAAPTQFGGKHAYRKRWKKLQKSLLAPESDEARAANIIRRKIFLLEGALRIIESKAASLSVLPILVCPEDFWDDNSSLTPSQAIPQSVLFPVFQQQMAGLSARYPRVLIMPGSVTASAPPNPADLTIYKQEGEQISHTNLPNRKKSHKDLQGYMQNCAPVFYNGVWLRYNCKDEYGEDYDDGYVFLGRTQFPTAASQPKLSKYKPSGISGDDFNSHIVQIHGFRFGEQICRDHRDVPLTRYENYRITENPLHFQVVVSETVQMNPDNVFLKPTGGYFIHCDGSPTQEDYVVLFKNGAEVERTHKVEEVPIHFFFQGSEPLKLSVFPALKMPAV